MYTIICCHYTGVILTVY